MKSSLFSKLIGLVLAVLLAGNALAASAHKGNLQVFDPVQVNGKQLPPGDYTITWNGDGPNVNLNIVRDGKVMATASAKLVPLEQKAEQDASEMKTSSTGAAELTAIRFSGKKYQLELGGASGQVADKSGDSVR
jgi:hypothetical protein